MVKITDVVQFQGIVEICNLIGHVGCYDCMVIYWYLYYQFLSPFASNVGLQNESIMLKMI